MKKISFVLIVCLMGLVLSCATQNPDLVQVRQGENYINGMLFIHHPDPQVFTSIRVLVFVPGTDSPLVAWKPDPSGQVVIKELKDGEYRLEIVFPEAEAPKMEPVAPLHIRIVGGVMEHSDRIDIDVRNKPGNDGPGKPMEPPKNPERKPAANVQIKGTVREKGGMGLRMHNPEIWIFQPPKAGPVASFPLQPDGSFTVGDLPDGVYDGTISDAPDTRAGEYYMLPFPVLRFTVRGGKADVPSPVNIELQPK